MRRWILSLALPLLLPAPASPAAAQARDRGAAQAVAAPTAGAAPTPAADAQYTIHCMNFSGPDHAAQARAAKAELTAAGKLKDWYVVIGESESALYHGFYRAFDAPGDKDSQRAQADRKAIDELTDAAGNRPFRHAIFVPLTSTDPAAPAEWDLRRAPGFWSLQIAAYMDSPQRKQAAVDAVKAARELGIEAYYYHGPTISSVCIGAWPVEAVRAQDAAAAGTTDPDQPLLVTNVPLPERIGGALVERSTGENVKTMTPKVEPVDPGLIEMMQRYPTHSINGERAVRRLRDPNNPARSALVEDPSFLVRIPVEADPAAQRLTNQQQLERARQMGLDVGQPSQQPRPGAGRLRSIGQ